MRNARPFTLSLLLFAACPASIAAQGMPDEGLVKYRAATLAAGQSRPQEWRYSDVEFSASSDANEVWNTGEQVNGSIEMKQGGHRLHMRIGADSRTRGLGDDSDEDRLLGLDEEGQEVGLYDMNSLRAAYSYDAGAGLNLSATGDDRGQFTSTALYKLSNQWSLTGYLDSNTDDSYAKFNYRPFGMLRLTGRYRADGDLYGNMLLTPKPGWMWSNSWYANEGGDHQRYSSFVRYARGLARHLKPTVGVDLFDYDYDNDNSDFAQRNLWLGVYSNLWDYTLEFRARYILQERNYLTADAAGSNFGRNDRIHVLSLSSWYALDNFFVGVDLNFNNRDSSLSAVRGTYLDTWLSLETKF